jgi:meso-butanediol dehydrogenase/(S,S)-butanediol dehydrogenase/diacetyl reductase
MAAPRFKKSRTNPLYKLRISMTKTKTTLVTGGASGIGAATVTRFAADGYRVVIADRDEKAASALKESLLKLYGEDSVDIFCLNLAMQEQVRAMVAFTETRFGSLDVLVNCAGVAGSGPVAMASPDHWQKVMDINLNAVFWASQAALKIMLKQGSGNIINIASISGLAGDVGFSSYSASKAAVINLTRTTALDHARDNIRVNAICPGAIDTPLIEVVLNNKIIADRALDAIPMGRPGQAKEIANVIRFISSDEASFMTGAVIPVDGGMTAWTGQPRFF